MALELHVDEDLPNFSEAIGLDHANEVILEYLNIKHNFGFEIEDP